MIFDLVVKIWYTNEALTNVRVSQPVGRLRIKFTEGGEKMVRFLKRLIIVLSAIAIILAGLTIIFSGSYWLVAQILSPWKFLILLIAIPLALLMALLMLLGADGLLSYCLQKEQELNKEQGE